MRITHGRAPEGRSANAATLLAGHWALLALHRRGAARGTGASWRRCPGTCRCRGLCRAADHRRSARLATAGGSELVEGESVEQISVCHESCASLTALIFAQNKHGVMATETHG